MSVVLKAEEGKGRVERDTQIFYCNALLPWHFSLHRLEKQTHTWGLVRYCGHQPSNQLWLRTLNNSTPIMTRRCLKGIGLVSSWPADLLVFIWLRAVWSSTWWRVCLGHRTKLLLLVMLLYCQLAHPVTRPTANFGMPLDKRVHYDMIVVVQSASVLKRLFCRLLIIFLSFPTVFLANFTFFWAFVLSRWSCQNMRLALSTFSVTLLHFCNYATLLLFAVVIINSYHQCTFCRV